MIELGKDFEDVELRRRLSWETADALYLTLATIAP